MEAFKSLENERYVNMLDRFLQLGGSRNMLLAATDIEVKLVEIGLEEDLYIDESRGMEIRRRRKQQQKKRRSGRGSQSADEMEFDLQPDMMFPPGSQQHDAMVEEVHQKHEAKTDLTVTPPPPSRALENTSIWDSRALINPKMESSSAAMHPNGHFMRVERR